MNPKMNRWIMASCRTWFDTKKLGDLTVFWEYSRHKQIQQQKQELQSYAEFRLNGPDYRRVSGNEEWYDVTINVLLTQNLNEGDSEAMEFLIGQVVPCFTNSIPVYKYGKIDDPENDESLIGCLQTIKGRDGEIEISRFGQANPDTLLTQTSIESEYRLKLLRTA